MTRASSARRKSRPKKRKAKPRKKKWAQKASARAKAKGTAGSFRRWCQRRGYTKVTAACIAEGKRSKSALIRKRANLAANYAKIRRKK